MTVFVVVSSGGYCLQESSSGGVLLVARTLTVSYRQRNYGALPAGLRRWPVSYSAEIHSFVDDYCAGVQFLSRRHVNNDTFCHLLTGRPYTGPRIQSTLYYSFDYTGFF